MRLGLKILPLALTVAACTVDMPTASPVPQPDAPLPEIFDASHGGGNSRFYFLPPMVPAPAVSGSSDGALAPEVRVCQWAGSCVTDVAAFSTTAGSGGEHVTYSGDQYRVNWKTDRCITGPCTLDPAQTYRLRVLVNGVELGHADVRLVENGSQLKNVNTQEYIGLVDGRTLPVKFRIETGIVGEVSVTPPAATVPIGGTATFTATARDLHGVPLTGRVVTWGSSAPAMVVVDGSGVVTGVGPGTSTISATSEGVTGTATATVESHWVTLAPLPTPRRGLSVVALGNLVYAIGGGSIEYNFIASTAVEAYDPVTITWSSRAPLPVGLSYSSTAVANGKIYVIGGWTGNLSAVSWVFAYDPGTNAWTQLGNAPHGISLGTANTFNGKIYVTNGYAGGYHTQTDAYDPATDSWTSLDGYPWLHAGPTGSGFIDGRLYLAGGEGLSEGHLEVFDVATSTWGSLASMPEVHLHGAGGTYNGKLYCFAGSDLLSNFTSGVLIYDPISDAWTRSEAGPTPRDLPAGAWLNGVFYIAGGATNTLSLTSAFEAYHP